MKIKTSEATGLQLDWGVAVAVGREPSFVFSKGKLHHIQSNLIGGGGWHSSYSHADPAVCMGLIEQYKMDVTWGTSGKIFVQMSDSDDDEWHGGKTLAEAVARCVIAMKLGDEFEVPDELGVQS